jgi:hypothetical protein
MTNLQTRVQVIGGGLAGLVASISCAEAGAEVTLYEAHRQLGGRARTTDGLYVAHEGPHVLYDGDWYRWLRARRLLGEVNTLPVSGLAGFFFRYRGRLQRRLPAGVLRLVLSRAEAPVDQDFFGWVAERHGPEVAAAASNLMGVVTFTVNPGRLSAAFVQERMQRVLGFPPGVRYVVGGWGNLVDRLAERAVSLGVRIETGARVDALPDAPVIVATGLDAAARLLGDASLTTDTHGAPRASGRTALLDLGLRPATGRRSRDAFVVSDADHAGWLERFSLADRRLAPRRHALVQLQMPITPTENRAAGTGRLEALADLALPGWRDRVEWRRDGLAERRTGALDLPGTTWRDRPAVDRGDGVFLAGDMVAAPGLLSEVSYASAVAAARGALAAVQVSAS